MSLWSQNDDLIAFCQSVSSLFSYVTIHTDVSCSGHLNVIRAFAGQTVARSADTAFDTEDYNEKEYVARIETQSGNKELVMNWWEV